MRLWLPWLAKIGVSDRHRVLFETSFLMLMGNSMAANVFAGMSPREDKLSRSCSQQMPFIHSEHIILGCFYIWKVIGKGGEVTLSQNYFMLNCHELLQLSSVHAC